MASPSDESMLVATSMGNRIRMLRRQLKLTLDVTAAAAGISKPFLSQIERGRAMPSIASLVGIARALGVTIDHFVGAPGDAPPACRCQALPQPGAEAIAHALAQVSHLANGTKLDATLFRIPAGQAAREAASYAGEEFLYVMNGEIELTLDGRTIVLKAGETAHYESTVAHAWSNAADEEAVIVWVGAPRQG
ncbi:XRE family transcriptional regulator [Burkholderia ubonensis]|uniref:helix-turn-helix domain-containing protein n=1 Tax=Burkholderia ubonensis TaxID=101571 RepID=UPI0007597FA8|nr:XRE family transcriptional regulator [Burkholderia ubonensis]KVA76690.1 XRE family transcriptional regulator [Burkholderia ubonensis]KVO50802.1 XRE family transcriptional regulator [Burkholderia ubonensis]KVP30401.1 XRE family transcriptional regulator [Burkholderia ubonensis]KVX36130.1 XRE family transcriptional regulator [Burkholderia ubonensis]KWB75127.1 XRE family transcriptional regulator [Burkholderia ubonensis]